VGDTYYKEVVVEETSLYNLLGIWDFKQDLKIIELIA
jgi:hypothetical protein